MLGQQLHLAGALDTWCQHRKGRKQRHWELIWMYISLRMQFPGLLLLFLWFPVQWGLKSSTAIMYTEKDNIFCWLYLVPDFSKDYLSNPRHNSWNSNSSGDPVHHFNIFNKQFPTYYMWKCDLLSTLCNVCTGQLEGRADKKIYFVKDRFGNWWQ